MPVTIKSEREISLMRESCRLLAVLHEELAQLIRPGISTAEIDAYGERRIQRHQPSLSEGGIIRTVQNIN